MNEKLKEFIDQCNEWLSQYGYTFHSFNEKKNVVLFSNLKDQSNPMVRCVMNGEQKSCSLIAPDVFKMSITLGVNDLQFKHPRFKDFVDAMKHYTILALSEPPNIEV